MKKITKEEANKRVEEIKEQMGDPETAHSEEDAIYSEFVILLSQGFYDDINEVKTVAEEISKTKQLQFPRWYA